MDVGTDVATVGLMLGAFVGDTLGLPVKGTVGSFVAGTLEGGTVGFVGETLDEPWTTVGDDDGVEEGANVCFVVGGIEG